MQSSGITKRDLLFVGAAALFGMLATIGLVGWVLFAAQSEASLEAVGKENLAVTDPRAPTIERADQVAVLVTPVAEGSPAPRIIDLTGTAHRVDCPASSSTFRLQPMAACLC